jgi:hypothetical protein
MQRLALGNNVTNVKFPQQTGNFAELGPYGLYLMKLTSNELDRMTGYKGFTQKLLCCTVSESVWRDSGKTRFKRELRWYNSQETNYCYVIRSESSVVKALVVSVFHHHFMRTDIETWNGSQNLEFAQRVPLHWFFTLPQCGTRLNTVRREIGLCSLSTKNNTLTQGSKYFCASFWWTHTTKFTMNSRMN